MSKTLFIEGSFVTNYSFTWALLTLPNALLAQENKYIRVILLKGAAKFLLGH